MRTYLFLTLLLIAVAADVSAAQRTFVSAANGDDANPCTRALPCRSFTAALLLTDADGEVIAVDSGGYGAVVLTQPASIISPAGVHAAITASSGNAITINAGDSAHVVLSNLSLSSSGGSFGIDANTVLALSVEHCSIEGFTDEGVVFDPTTANACLYVTDTIVRRSGVSGIHVIGGTGIQATIESSRLYDNVYTSIAVYKAYATVRDCVASGSIGNPNIWAQDGGATIVIDKTVSTDSVNGFFSGSSSTIILTRCAATANTTGLRATGTLYVSDSTITNNGLGVKIDPGATIASRGNNRLQANTTNGAFSGSFSGQ
jgi:hypothetical protein